MVLLAVLIRPCAAGGQNALQIRTGSGDDKVPGIAGEGLKDLLGIFLSRRLACDDDCAGLNLTPSQSRRPGYSASTISRTFSVSITVSL